MEKMLELIHHHLEQSLDCLKDGPVKEAMRYSLLAPGKRLRAVLFLKVLQSYSIDYVPYLDIACSIEMIHTYSLIHDDLPAMDNDDLRRGLKTCHIAFDEATAILAGDGLLTHAFTILSNAAIDDSKKIKCIQILSEFSGQNGMIYGQQQDIYYENKIVDLNALEDIHIHKTGKLIMAPLMMAGVIAGVEDLSPFAALGQKIGLAYQIQDDILDIIGDQMIIGKKVGSDLENNKSTYVSLLGIETSKQRVEDYFREALELVYHMKINHGVLIEIIQIILKRVK